VGSRQLKEFEVEILKAFNTSLKKHLA